MGDVLDRWRLNRGYNPRDEASLQMEIASYVATLDGEEVPASAYNELYERMLRTRAAAIQNNRALPEFGAELLLAEWLGPNGLKAESREREIRRGRTLGENAESVCQHCLGTGFKRMGTERHAPVVRCLHV